MKTHEWAVIFLVMGLLTFLGVTSHQNRVKSQKNLRECEAPATITIYFTGAVKNQGPYTCPSGTTLKELLKQVKLQKAIHGLGHVIGIGEDHTALGPEKGFVRGPDEHIRAL